jgi:hypothetical protein
MPAKLNGDVPWGVTLGRYWHGPEQFGERQRYSGERNLLLFGGERLRQGHPLPDA